MPQTYFMNYERDVNGKHMQDYYFKKFGMYIDNAKIYIQISVGALILPITFIRQLTGNDHSPIQLDFFMKWSWASFLVSIASGLLYQWLAVRKVEFLIENTKSNWFIQRPGYVCGVMLISFFGGQYYLWLLHLLGFKYETVNKGQEYFFL
jgi:hypothetical protein